MINRVKSFFLLLEHNRNSSFNLNFKFYYDLMMEIVLFNLKRQNN